MVRYAKGADQMQTALPFPLARDDTLLGVCQALGEDFGFNPFYLRLALGVALIWNPVLVVGGYLAAAVVVAVIRLVVPEPSFAEATAGKPAAAAEGNDNADREMAIAA